LLLKRHGARWKSALLFGALYVAASVTAPDLAGAQGFFDFLFGGSQQRSAPPPDAYPPPPPEVGRIAPAPLGPESVTGGDASTGHAVAFCVRLCDGQHFPMERMVNGTPVETCRAICPYSKTKVFVGSEIAGAVAQDGQQYASLDTAFVYRKQLVANCTCNGRDAFGLVSFDVMKDPTLQPGDIVSTKDGLLSYTGKSGQGAAFTPVNPATLPPDISPRSSQPRPQPSTESAADEDPGTIVPQGKQQLQSAPPVANPQGSRR
jgi:hypothetical protein